MMGMFQDVEAFHAKFDLPRKTSEDEHPRMLTDSERQFRVNFMMEELDEYLTACVESDMPKAFDALMDLVYVALGTAVMHRFPWDEGWREVQRANMTKERATSAGDSRSTRGHSLDVVKPEGWRPPDIAGVLLRAGIRQMGRDNRFSALAKTVAQWSKDPNTKVGAVIVGGDPRRIAVGYNGFPPGIEDSPERLMNRELKNRLMQHAERNALDNATFDTRGATLYCTLFPCVSCAKSIVSKGIARIVCDEVPTHAPWAEEAAFARTILDEAGVKVS